MSPRPRSAEHTPLVLPAGARILVLKLASPGDVLLATPALRALRQRYPHARLDVLTTPAGAAVLARSPLVDAVLTLEKYAFDSPGDLLRAPLAPLALVPLLLRLRRARYDAVLLLHHLTLPAGRRKFRLLLLATGARHRVGLENGTGGFLTLGVPDGGFGARHEAAYALDVAAAVDAPLPTGARGLRLSDLGLEALGEQGAPPTATADRPPRVALHPGSGTYSVARRWPAERFAELAVALHERWGATCVLLGGAEEQALRATVRVAAGSPPWLVEAAPTTDPADLVALLRGCDLFVGNDSFPMHLAVAARLPVVAIFGPSNAEAWGPYAPEASARVRVVRRRDLACSPCFYRGHALGTPQGCPPRPCLTALGLGPVLAAVEDLLRPARPIAPSAG